MREKSAKQGLAILLAAAVLLTGMTVPVFADDGNLPEAGSEGTLTAENGTVTLDGKTVTPVKSGSRYVVWIRDIKAADQAASQAVGQ